MATDDLFGETGRGSGRSSTLALRDITHTLHNIHRISPKSVKRQRLDPMPTSTTTVTPNPPSYRVPDHGHYKHQISSLQSQVSSFKGEVFSLKNQLSKEEFAFTQLDDHYISLKDELAALNAAADNVAHQKHLQIANIQKDYTLECRNMNVAQEKRENLLKDKFTNEASDIIQTRLAQQHEKVKHLRTLISDRSNRNDAYNTELNSTLAELRSLHESRLKSLTKEIDDTIIPLQQTITKLNDKTAVKTEDIMALESRKITLGLKLAKYNSILDRIQPKSASKVQELSSLEQMLKITEDKTLMLKRLTSTKKAEMKAMATRNIAITDYLRDQEDNRRHLHNKLQELKGNIRVFCRIRPISNDERADIQVVSGEINADGKEMLTIQRPPAQVSGAHPAQQLQFQFDKVFQESLSNKHVFHEISQLIQSCLDGYNVCVFAYGQTGLGKTYTMSHSQDGVIPLSLTKIYSDIDALRQKGWLYTVQGQFIEIYNDSIVDLLAPNDTAKYEIKHDDVAKTTSISNVRIEQIDTFQQAQKLVAFATKNRTTACTMSNERSSRSHSIFILKLQGRNTNTGATCEGSLNMVDLAGLERLAASQVKGHRLKETQAINKSLLSLGDVIYALNNNKPANPGHIIGHHHIPYRNSKLTYLLKHSLGGNSKTLMFVNVSPSLQNVNETVSSLRFATKVNATKVADC